MNECCCLFKTKWSLTWHVIAWHFIASVPLINSAFNSLSATPTACKQMIFRFSAAELIICSFKVFTRNQHPLNVCAQVPVTSLSSFQQRCSSMPKMNQSESEKVRLDCNILNIRCDVIKKKKEKQALCSFTLTVTVYWTSLSSWPVGIWISRTYSPLSHF